MLKKITIEIAPDELKVIVRDAIRAQFGAECSVDFEVDMEYHGHGTSEIRVPGFKGATVRLTSTPNRLPKIDTLGQ